MRRLITKFNKYTMDINDEIDMQDLKYKVKELQEKNEELQVELDITKEQLILSGVSQQCELLFCDFCKEDNPHKKHDHKKMKECEGCGLITKL